MKKLIGTALAILFALSLAGCADTLAQARKDHVKQPGQRYYHKAPMGGA